MRHTDILRTIMRKNKVSQMELASRLGISNSNAVTLRLFRKTGTIMALTELAEGLDHEVVLRPATEEPLAADEYVLHYSDYKGEDEP